MGIFIKRRRKNLLYKVLSCFITLTFLFNFILPPVPANAQGVLQPALSLPAPGTLLSTSPAYRPALVKGITIDTENPLHFDFIINKGDSNLEGVALRNESLRLVKYFLAAMTVPEKELWVNLSPYEKDRIIPQNFGMTEMGKDLLAQDYLLKQLSASLMYPEDALGQEFWSRVFEKAYERYGTTDIPINTFNKIWVVPQEAVIYEHENSAFIVKSHLKVMLEEDYLALNQNLNNEIFGTDHLEQEDVKEVSALSSDVVREVLIPAIEKEVNEGENFAQLRQIYHSVILATWYKQNLKESLLGQVYIDQNKVKGVDIEDTKIKQKIFQQYLAAFKKGAYNFIKEDIDPYTKELVPRKYFSGGFNVSSSGVMSTVLDKGQAVRLMRDTWGAGSGEFGTDLEKDRIVDVRLATLGPQAEATSVLTKRLTSSPVSLKKVLSTIALCTVLGACSGGGGGGKTSTDVDVDPIDQIENPTQPGPGEGTTKPPSDPEELPPLRKPLIHMNAVKKHTTLFVTYIPGGTKEEAQRQGLTYSIELFNSSGYLLGQKAGSVYETMKAMEEAGEKPVIILQVDNLGRDTYIGMVTVRNKAGDKAQSELRFTLTPENDPAPEPEPEPGAPPAIKDISFTKDGLDLIFDIVLQGSGQHLVYIEIVRQGGDPEGFYSFFDRKILTEEKVLEKRISRAIPGTYDVYVEVRDTDNKVLVKDQKTFVMPPYTIEEENAIVAEFVQSSLKGTPNALHDGFRNILRYVKFSQDPERLKKEIVRLYQEVDYKTIFGEILKNYNGSVKAQYVLLTLIDWGMVDITDILIDWAIKGRIKEFSYKSTSFDSRKLPFLVLFGEKWFPSSLVQGTVEDEKNPFHNKDIPEEVIQRAIDTLKRMTVKDLYQGHLMNELRTYIYGSRTLEEKIKWLQMFAEDLFYLAAKNEAQAFLQVIAYGAVTQQDMKDRYRKYMTWGETSREIIREFLENKEEISWEMYQSIIAFFERIPDPLKQPYINPYKDGSFNLDEVWLPTPLEKQVNFDRPPLMTKSRWKETEIWQSGEKNLNFATLIENREFARALLDKMLTTSRFSTALDLIYQIKDSLESNVYSVSGKKKLVQALNQELQSWAERGALDQIPLFQMAGNEAWLREIFSLASDFFQTHFPTQTNYIEISVQQLPASSSSAVGGINFDPALLDMQIKRDENGIPLKMEFQPVDLQENVQGFFPVIINMTPVNVPMLLGFKDGRFPEPVDEQEYSIYPETPMIEPKRMES